MVTSDYVIVIDGELDHCDALELGPVTVTLVGGRSTLLAHSIDQAALHGILNRLGELGLTLLSVTASSMIANRDG